MNNENTGDYTGILSSGATIIIPNNISTIPISTITTTGGSTTGYWYPNQNQLTSSIASATNVGDSFINITGSFQLHAHGKEYQVVDILNLCKNIKYMKINNEIIITKVVWDALFTYINGENAYANLSPSEFIDKVFGVESSK